MYVLWNHRRWGLMGSFCIAEGGGLDWMDYVDSFFFFSLHNYHFSLDFCMCFMIIPSTVWFSLGGTVFGFFLASVFVS